MQKRMSFIWVPSNEISCSDGKETQNNPPKIVNHTCLREESVEDYCRTYKTRINPKFKGENNKKL